MEGVLMMINNKKDMRKSPFNFFTVEEVNLICMYNKDNRQKAIDGLYHALAEVRDLDMLAIICRTLDKLQCISNTEFAEIEFVEEYS